MNKKLNLVEILKNCPKGWRLYSTLVGEVEFERILDDTAYPVVVLYNGRAMSFTNEGFYYEDAGEEAECLLFPSAERRNWDKFKAPWYKRERFDPKTLKAFDKVLVRDSESNYWKCNIFSHMEMERSLFPYTVVGGNFSFCIPYNDDTKHLVGTKDQPSEFYRYWEV